MTSDRKSWLNRLCPRAFTLAAILWTSRGTAAAPEVELFNRALAPYLEAVDAQVKQQAIPILL